MSPFAENVLIGLCTGLMSGLITGFYSALVTSKAIRFNSLKSEALRSINSIEYMSEGTRTTIKRGDFKNLLYIVGELIHFGYRKAGLELATQNHAILDALTKAEYGQCNVAELEERINVAQTTIRSISPGWRFLNPFGRI